MHKLVLIRHGESRWNWENRFTGWTDVDLTDFGRHQAQQAGDLLRAHGFEFDCAFSSVLRRAIRTLWVVLDTMDLMYLPATCDWRLNERHYGALQGLNKAETAERYGEEQVLQWRRAYRVAPEPLDENDSRHPRFDKRYRDLPAELLPATESLHDTVARVVPYWENTITPAIRSGKRVIIAAHGNSLRALIKHLDGISDEDIVGLNIPTAQPIVYELNDAIQPLRRYYLAKEEDVRAATQAVADQGKAVG